MPPLILGAVISFVVNLFITVANTIVTVVSIIVPYLLKIWDGVFFVFKKVGKAVELFARAAARFGRWVWDSVLSKIVPTLKRWWARFTDFIQKIIKPVLEVLKKITGALDRWFVKFVAPILNWLEKARLIFSILGKLGVKWAQWLADWIQKIITAITETFTTIVNHIQIVENFINDLLTPEGWIKGKPFLLSIQRWGGGVVSILVELGLDEELETRQRRTAATREIKVLPMRVGEFASLLVKQHPAVRSAVSDFATLKTKKGETSRW